MILVKKLKFFHVLCLSKIDRKRVLADVLDKKDAFKDYKKQLFMKNAKGLLHRCGQKFAISSTLIFMQNRQRKSIWKRSS